MILHAAGISEGRKPLLDETDISPLGETKSLSSVRAGESAVDSRLKSSRPNMFQLKVSSAKVTLHYDTIRYDTLRYVTIRHITLCYDTIRYIVVHLVINTNSTVLIQSVVTVSFSSSIIHPSSLSCKRTAAECDGRQLARTRQHTHEQTQ